MISNPLQPNQLQTFFVSHETTKSPIINEIIETTKKISQLINNNDIEGMVSIGYGKRTLITAEPSKFSTLVPEQLIEIIDYDTYKQILLIMGKKEPINDVAIHWIIHHAKKEIGAITLINNFEKTNTLFDQIPLFNANPTGAILDRSKIILKALQKNKILHLEGEGILITGRTLFEIIDIITKHLD
jgi:hypothetical protein